MADCVVKPVAGDEWVAAEQEPVQRPPWHLLQLGRLPVVKGLSSEEAPVLIRLQVIFVRSHWMAVIYPLRS